MSFISAISTFYLSERRDARLRDDPNATHELVHAAIDASRGAIDAVASIVPRSPEERDAALGLLQDLTAAGEWQQQGARIRANLSGR